MVIMDPDGSGRGDHHQVQAAAGRAVGGGPPLSAAASVTATASATASSLTPPAPSATDAAVQPRARESGDPIPPPVSAAAATATGIEYPRSDEEEPPTPAQTGANYDAMEGAIKELTEHVERDDDAPVPPVQTAAEYEEMENTIIKSVQQSDDAPLPPSQIAALTDEERGNDEIDGKEKPAPTTDTDVDTPPTPTAAFPSGGRDEAIPTRSPSADPPTSPSPPTGHDQISSTVGSGQQPIIVRPPPQSMLPVPDEDASTPSDLPASVRFMPQATLVVDPPIYPATRIQDPPEIPISPPVQVVEQTWLKKHQKYIFGALGLFVGLGVAVAVGLSPGSNIQPSESSSPSDVPSLRPTDRPSQSSSPSPNPSQSHSAKPSTKPTPLPSSSPSKIPSSSLQPSPFCFGGEINILTDSYPEEISWTLSRIDNVDGVATSKEVIEGSPEEEGYRTSDEACLERGDYEFAIFDSCGDGIFSPGYYSVVFEGVVIAQGGDFESEERISFSLPLPSFSLPLPSLRPSESSSPSETPSPSFRPSNSFSPSTYWSSLNWSGQGLGFNGDAPDDLFGRAVAFSADASTMAIGASGFWVDNDRPGYVKVYGRKGEGSSWEQRGDTIRGEADGDQFGFSLALSEDGTTLSIGAPRHVSVGSDSGQVKVYEWDETALNYVQIGDTLYGAAFGDDFGWSLDISIGKILAVGARYSNANGSNSGQVMVYAWDEASSNFKQRGGAINGNAAGNEFGYSVSLSGNGQKLAVAPYNDWNGRYSGQVRVFEWDEATSNYKQMGDSLLGDAAGNWFGRRVSFSRDGTTLAIEAPYNDENGQDSGQVKVFAWDEAALNFEQIGQSLYGKVANDEFGSSVSLSSDGKTLAIGGHQSDAFKKPGYVEVYGWDEGALEYKQLGKNLGGEASGDRFGYALALAGNGRDLAVGAWGNDRNGTRSGRVEVFHIEL